MDIKVHRVFLILGFMILSLAPLLAQAPGYYVELRFVQRFTWIADEYAMRYEVVIEKEESRRFGHFMREFTEANFIEVSLPPGKFRYQVIPRDFLDQPIPVAEWMEFEIRPGDDTLTTGEHEIILLNPGDESSRREIVLTAPQVTEATTEYVNQFDIYLGASYIPLVPLYSENRFFGENLSLLGASMRLGAISSKPLFLGIRPGMDIAASWRTYAGEEPPQSIMFDLNLLAQLFLPGDKMALDFRAGAGVSLLANAQPVSATGQYSIHANMGVSFLWLFLKSFYLEAGAEYSQFFTKDYFGFIRPRIGLGYRF